eukprot:GHVO01059902.1.p1 GENE.GHVO01059902.1~~GHVO01059902.1.p1  ORF type:complete len:130 (+),score=9.58 GHVO01059902.1:131-520(+)
MCPWWAQVLGRPPNLARSLNGHAPIHAHVKEEPFRGRYIYIYIYKYITLCRAYGERIHPEEVDILNGVPDEVTVEMGYANAKDEGCSPVDSIDGDTETTAKAAMAATASVIVFSLMFLYWVSDSSYLQL